MRSNLFEIHKWDKNKKFVELTTTCSVDNPHLYDMWEKAFETEIANID